MKIVQAPGHRMHYALLSQPALALVTTKEFVSTLGVPKRF